MLDSPGRKYPSSPIEHTFMRSHAPKYASYYGDGFGRDSYIILNNGGLASSQKPNMMKRPFRNTFHGEILSTPCKESSAITYKSDGSGRDSYVIQNSGGLVADYKYKRADLAFKDHLRYNVQSPVPHHASARHGPHSFQADITQYLNWPSGSQRK